MIFRSLTSISFPKWLGVIFCVNLCSTQIVKKSQDFDNSFFISEIFKKYGNNNSMTFEGFEHLLANLGLGKLKFETNHDVSFHKVNGTFLEFHDVLSLHEHNHNTETNETERSATNPEKKKRNVNTEKLTKDIEKFIARKCLTPQDILITYGLQPHHDVVISPANYLEICPAIIYELDQKLCQEEEFSNVADKLNEYHLIWIYASVSIFLMGASGLLCVLAVPIVKRNYFTFLVHFLISLATGTLCGDALIHLLPQTFSGFESSTSDSASIAKGTFILLAILLFFFVENLLQGVKTQKKNKKRNLTDRELDVILAKGEIPEQKTSHDDGIKTVAWMAIMGDVLHNVTDGLSIGAAFTSSLSAGFASSIAIFCHELPHELGDYAILIASGMSIKKSLFYNFLSSIFSFIGMVAGVLLGEIPDVSRWINAFTAGSFLYIALSDLVPEMKMMISRSFFKSFVVQMFGIFCGGLLMFSIALYEDKIEKLLG